ncbi:3-methyl-2-oxobutanoate hydroxymethyltransferase [Caldisphaera sp.]|jgi:3-methyl-2-oxobutanoate hydroxymethyltransferase|uniref:3-methyl-2-oxobutanoate hydroxymethyltransferase n=1 Tax=Caldisphaera sp. TaxID=2060322 RepID=UPI003979F0F8
MEEKKKTIRDIQKMKGKKRIVAITSYDYPTAKIVDETGVDIILVGDSLGMVVLGYPSTLQVSMNEMLIHTKAVCNANPKALVVSDMPFMSYEYSKEKAIINASRFLRIGSDAVKLEGGSEYKEIIKGIVNSGIPVMGHIGLTPQKHKQIGGYRLLGKSYSEANEILNDALQLEDSGIFSLVIEYTTNEVAKKITEKISIPTICIGSGPYCDGQIMVINDLLGLGDYSPEFAKKYVDLKSIIREAILNYKSEVENGKFPEKYWSMKSDEDKKKFMEET